MRFPGACFLQLLASTGCAPGSTDQPELSADTPLLETEFPALPDDASTLADRLASCVHFAGEFNGDRSERDKEVAAAMADLRCDAIDADVAVIRNKYPGNTQVLEALKSADEL